MRYGALIAFCLIAGVGYAGWRWIDAQPKAEQSQGGGRRGGRGGRFSAASTAVPVSVAPVKIETVPIYREGIGNLVARMSVTVRAQIDGKLLSVAFADGQEVKKGEALARIDPAIYQAQLEQALAKKAQDEATLANARRDLERYRSLAASAAGTKQQADQQAALVDQLVAQLQSDDAAIDTAKTYLGYTTITAPLDGRAGLRQIDPGNVIHASDANGLVTITQITPIDAVFSLPQRDLPLVAAAQARGPVPAQILSSQGAPVESGQLRAIDNQIDASTGTIRLKASFPNAGKTLWPGQFVTARVRVDLIEGARVVPATAIRRGPEGTFVYVLGADSHVAARPVEIATQDEARAVISKGVEAGEQVVTVGFQRLSPGAEVVVAPDISAPGATPSAGPQGAAAPGGGAAPAKGEQGRRGRGDGQGRPNRPAPPGKAGEGAAAPSAPAAAPSAPATVPAR